MSTSSSRRWLIGNLEEKEYRDSYVAANIRNGIAFQIRAMRERRNWTQTELGARTGMRQRTISSMEDPNYGRYTISTLRRLASAFDVALSVKFIPYSDLVRSITRLSEDDLAVPGFDEDRLLKVNEVEPLVGASETAINTVTTEDTVALMEGLALTGELETGSVVYAHTPVGDADYDVALFDVAFELCG